MAWKKQIVAHNLNSVQGWFPLSCWLPNSLWKMKQRCPTYLTPGQPGPLLLSLILGMGNLSQRKQLIMVNTLVQNMYGAQRDHFANSSASTEWSQCTSYLMDANVTEKTVERNVIVKRFSCACFEVIKVTQNELNFLLAVKELQMLNSPANCEFLSIFKCLWSCYLILNDTVIFWRIIYIKLVSFLKVNRK